MAKKTPLPADRHVGNRIRMRRLMLSMSQEKLADKIGLTFQQVQKYEKGTNRVGASRLAQIATALNCQIPFFFEGLPGGAGHHTADVGEWQQFLATDIGQRLVVAVTTMTPKLRNSFVNLAEAVATA